MNTVTTNTNPTAAADYTASGAPSKQSEYSHPVSGISLSHREIDEYASGRKTNEKGDVVFFRPSYVDEDPWKSIRGGTVK
jgi:hypothetical protein